MAGRTYRETFDNGPGGWLTWHGHRQPPGPPEMVDSALISRSPWDIDSNHAPPGGSYLHLLFILYTALEHLGPAHEPLVAGNRFIEGGYPTDFRHATVTARLRGEVELQGAQLVLHCQSSIGGKHINFVLTGQPFEVTSQWSEQSITLTPDPEQWLCLGSRHDRTELYAWGEIEDVLRDVNLDIILLLHPLQVVPLTPEEQGPHHHRPEVDYPVDRSYLPEGYILLDEIRIDFAG